MQISLPQQQMPMPPPSSAAKKKKTGLALALAVVLAIVVGLTLAWLTASDTKHNVFEFGDVDIDLIEPEWDKNADKDITLPDGSPAKMKTGVYPGMETPKDPTIVNNGSAEAWVYVSVEVPCLDDGTPIFHWDKINDGWVLDDEMANSNGTVYTFIYTEPLPGKKDDTPSQTPPVFDKVIINGDLSNEDIETLKQWYPEGVDLVVNGLGIQKEGLGAATAKEALEAYYGESAAVVLDLANQDRSASPAPNFLNTGIEPLPMQSYGETQDAEYALVFVRENLSGIPVVGEEFEGCKVLAVYKGIDDLPYYSQDEIYAEDADTEAMLNEIVPWTRYMSDIYSVATIDPIAPKNTSYWFIGLPHHYANDLIRWYLPYLDTTQTVHMDNMYANKQSACRGTAPSPVTSPVLAVLFGPKTVFSPECGINVLVYNDYLVQMSTLNYWGRECTDVEGQYMGIDFAAAYNDNPKQMSKDTYGLFYFVPN